ncbi:MAG: DUF4386 domain-containing protein [Caldilinea sp.]|uniref:DUF4386 domain-containing protein n=1 Tax=Caldilinea sp. TaxID=2293560 RepID=UPI002C6192B4|nr:DUF4386 domain-containing protein [Anaerolineales bacterium]HQY92904.1 DUF4386 domain-containing protein [Caldilinea sp.]HRA65441.1 DUF4386 domain-containing protein [Caldilinea sp.]
MTTTATTHPNRTARIAGLLYLLLVPLGILGIMYVPNALIVAGDMSATASQIAANQSIFRLSMVSALLAQLVNIAVVLTLYKLLQPVNATIARLMVLFSLLAVPIAMLNEVNHAAVLLLVNSADQSSALMALFLELHRYGVQIAGIFWGLWLFPMGYLVFKSTYLPKLIGVLLMIGCLGYVADSLVFLLFPTFGVTFSEFTFIGEVALPVWLLVKGVNVQRWNERARNATVAQAAPLRVEQNLPTPA